MRKSIVFVVSLLLGGSSVMAAEMFEAYPKKFALGWVADEANARYWFTPAWGLDASLSLNDEDINQKSDDGITKAEDRADANAYAVSLAALRTLKSHPYFDLNLKAGVTFARSTENDDPEGPNNSARAEMKRYSVHIGPEVEVKVPYFSRFVIVSSLRAEYTVEKESVYTESVGGPTTVSAKTKNFSLSSGDNSLDEFFRLGIRYYF